MPINGKTAKLMCLRANNKALTLSTTARLKWLSYLLIGSALICLPFADIEVTHLEPGAELERMLAGLRHPDWQQWKLIVQASGQTIAFALLAVAGACSIGLVLAIGFHRRWVRVLCAATRSVHELFWGLLLMQVLGLSTLTGVLAIMLPYSGVFARVFAAILEQQSPEAGSTLSPKTDRISHFSYTRIAPAWGELRSYTRYRFECALRSSAILGFIGLPTLGFHLETAFRQGQYDQGAAILISFFVLIASIRYWLRPHLLPLLVALALWLLPSSPPMQSGQLWQFISHDIWPAPLLNGDVQGTWRWYYQQLSEVALPALIDTLLLSQLALVLSGFLALLCYGFACKRLTPSPFYLAGQSLLLVMRSTPEIVFAFILLLLLGPSGLPAVLALAIHNGGLIAYLLALQADQLTLRADAPSGCNGYLYEITPRLYSRFIALLLYRWEVILRESAILGILGVTTLGFYIHSAFEDIRYDRALLLIIVAALLNIAIDALARRMQAVAST